VSRGQAHPGSPGCAVRRSAGQASVELLGALPVVLLVGVFCLQLLAVGYSATLAGSAAEAGALAAAAGADPRVAVRESLPGWSRARASVEVGTERVDVRLRPPSPLRILAKRLEVEASASVREG
jgi:hypothetical protein